jgi:hypothetical protein
MFFDKFPVRNGIYENVRICSIKILKELILPPFGKSADVAKGLFGGRGTDLTTLSP